MAGFYGGMQRPGLIAGLNYGHPCAIGALFAIVAEGGANAVDLIRRQNGTRGSTVSGSQFPYIGKGLLGDNSQNCNVSWSSRRAVSDHQFTAGAICYYNAASSDGNVVFTLATGAASWGIILDSASAGVFSGTDGTVDVNADTLTTGVPYFLAFSANADTGIWNFVSRRLDTGRIVQTTVSRAATTPGAGGTYQANGAGLSVPPSGFGLAAVFASNQYLTAAALLGWAQEPWAIFDDGDNMMARVAQFANTRRLLRQSLSVSETSTSGLVARVVRGKALSVVAATTVNLVKSTGKGFAVVAASTVNLARSISNSRAVAGASVAALAASKKAIVTAAVAEGSGPALAAKKNASVPISVSDGSTTALAKQTTKAIPIVESSVAIMVRQTAKSFAAAVNSTLAVATVRHALLVVSVVEGSAALLSRRIGKLASSVQSNIANVVRRTAKTVAATTASTGAIATAKTIHVVVSAADALVAALSRATKKGQSIVVAEGSVALLSRQIGKPLAVAQSSVGALLKSIGLKRGVLEGSTAALARMTRKSMSLLAGSASAMGRSIGKLLPFWSLTAPSMTRQIGKGIAAIGETRAAIAKATGKNFNAAASSIGALLHGALHPRKLATINAATGSLLALAQHPRALAAASATVAVLGRLKGVILIAASGSSVPRLVASRFVALGTLVQTIASLGARFLRYVLGRFIIGTNVVRGWKLASVARGWTLGPLARKWRIGRTK
jgi:hypothetical protein